MNRKEEIKAILSVFVYNVIERMEKEVVNNVLSFCIFLHDKDGLYPNGLSISKDVLDFSKPIMVDSFRNQLERYLDSLKYVVCENNIIDNSRFHYSFRLTFRETDYYVDKLNKSFFYGEIPSVDDVELILKDFVSSYKKLENC